MEVGPFTINEVENIKLLFESKRISYEIFIDEERKNEILQNFNDPATVSPKTMAGSLDLKIVFFEISDEDYQKVKLPLEKYGIVISSDGSYELGED